MAEDYLGEPQRPPNTGDMSSKDIQKMMVAFEDSDIKSGGIVNLVKDGGVIRTWKNVGKKNKTERYYDYFTCKELVDYKASE